jgi:ribosomal protein S18 acetylase RimI-like enzyme
VSPSGLTMTDDELYDRGFATLVASFEEYARGAEDASLELLAGVAAGVFPKGPERYVYNNALLERGLEASSRASAIDAMEAAYAARGIERFAAWVHESDHALQADLEQRGYTLGTTTRAMGMSLESARLPERLLDLAPPSWDEHLRIAEIPPGFLRNADRDAFQVVIGRLDGVGVATALAYDFERDRGIYNVGTLEHARRRGLGTAVTLALLRDAARRGCATASLQATPMAEHLYADLGFRNLGRILEYVPR